MSYLSARWSGNKSKPFQTNLSGRSSDFRQHLKCEMCYLIGVSHEKEVLLLVSADNNPYYASLILWTEQRLLQRRLGTFSVTGGKKL